MWRLNVASEHLKTCVENAVFGVNEHYSFRRDEVLLLQLLKGKGEGGRENIEQAGYSFESILNKADLVIA